MPEIMIIAGPNGAGKTSFANTHFGTDPEGFTFVNADEIARTLSNHSNYLAGREMLNQIKYLAQQKSDFVIETTLATLSYAKKIPIWQSYGYKVVLLYIRLPSVETSIARVKHRVSNGGHNILEQDIRRRFPRSLDYLETKYKPIVDEWYIYDSLEANFKLIETWED